MVQLVLIGIGAGAATALLFASVVSGSVISIILACLAPLPILIAALGWSHWAGLIAALVGALSLSVALGPALFLSFLIRIGLPAWWLGYLALLARPSASSPERLEWYPAGNLVVWAAVLSAVSVFALLLGFGFDDESVRTGLRSTVERFLRALAPDKTVNQQWLEFFVVAIPLAIAISLTLINLINLWLAGRVVKVSGRLKRPPSDLAAMEFPPWAPALIGAAVAGSFLPGLIGTAATVLTFSLLTAYAVLGFAVLHAVTRGMDSRPFLLGGVYAAVIVFGWPGLVMTLLGLADTAFDIRGRVARKRRPPQAPIS